MKLCCFSLKYSDDSQPIKFEFTQKMSVSIFSIQKVVLDQNKNWMDRIMTIQIHDWYQ